MINRTTLLQKPRLTISIGIGICLLISGVLTFSSGAKQIPQQNSAGPEVVNKTQAFELLSASREDNSVVLKLKNGYNKDINGYSISSGIGLKDDVDLTIGDRVITPGEIIEYRVGIPNTRSASTTSSQQPIIILAVMFKDHTSDGDLKTISDIEDRRLGVKMQLRRIFPLLEAALNSPDIDTPSVIARLKTQLSTLPEELNEAPRLAVKRGLRAAKEDVLRRIGDLDSIQHPQSGTNHHQALIKIKEEQERRAARL